jgi:hypothetical protein
MFDWFRFLTISSALGMIHDAERLDCGRFTTTSSALDARSFDWFRFVATSSALDMIYDAEKLN